MKTESKRSGRNIRHESLTRFTPQWRDIPPDLSDFWRRAFDPSNLRRACRRVVSNGGAPGTDSMTVTQLPVHLSRHLPLLLARITRREYRPLPLLVVDIPKPDGSGYRRLRIPSVLDRFVQQTMLQILEPRFDPGFSDFSFGYRLGRSAHDAVGIAQQFINRGLTSILHLDIEDFFDRVRHADVLRLVARRVEDPLCLHLLRQSLETIGISRGGRKCPDRGLPQGSPLSPLLANVVLHEFDTALERRKQPFVRYADDCILLAPAPSEARRLLLWSADFLRAQLALDLHPQKTAVVEPAQIAFLGFTFGRNGREGYRREISPQAIAAFQARVRGLISNPQRSSAPELRHRLHEYVRGWMESFSFCETPWVLEELREFVRHELRRAAGARRPPVEHQAATTASGLYRNSVSVPTF